MIRGVVRTDMQDYPEEAIREALLNAIVHRDCGFSGSIIINVTDQRMEFISPGGLLPGLGPDDIRSGISQPGNKNLAGVFHRLHLIESYGTGIRRIFSLYDGCPQQPRIEVTPNTFKMILPNTNTAAEPEDIREADPRMRKVLDHIREYGSITEYEISEMLGLKKTRTYTITEEMRDRGLIRAVGRGESRYYVLLKDYK